MTDEKREKVIKGLEQFIDDFGPFCGNKADWQRVYDAIALLKAQEPVKPIVGHNIGPTWWYACGECKGAIDIGDKFCRHCGRELKWES